jgi:hypothetical protein
MKPNSIDFMKALKVLYPFKDALEKVKEAFDHDEFDTIEITDPWSAITYFRSSEAYVTYDIEHLSHKIYEAIKDLNQYQINNHERDQILKLLGTEITNCFDGWKLDQVYMYLMMIFEDLKHRDNIPDQIIIENSIIRGDILSIINCFLIRI